MASTTNALSGSTNSDKRATKGVRRFTQWEWTAKRSKAAILVAEDAANDEVIAETIGISRQALFNWKSQPEFQERVAEHIHNYAVRVRGRGLARIEKRIEAKNERWMGLRTVVRERGEDPEMAEVPGGKTGLIVRERKSIGFGRDSEIVDQYVVDTGLLRAMNDLEKEAAQELGQWAEKHEHSGPDGGPIPIMALDMIVNAADAASAGAPPSPSTVQTAERVDRSSDQTPEPPAGG